jgi:hypothetical protein
LDAKVAYIFELANKLPKFIYLRSNPIKIGGS